MIVMLVNILTGWRLARGDWKIDFLKNTTTPGVASVNRKPLSIGDKSNGLQKGSSGLAAEECRPSMPREDALYNVQTLACKYVAIENSTLLRRWYPYISLSK
uniref:Uncharacterized protein n=1 Tax=Vespula pensylvanica TaxID=30213 RepID=A0A834UAN4_VESPE|nr:hypothetical protein H0235_006554 [Vespula pensylvanica]